MPRLFKIEEGVPCRACGAVSAPAHDNRWKLCDNCWTSVCLFAGISYNHARGRWNDDGVTDDTVTGWLARKLVKDLKRLERNGLVGRCEAVTHWQDGNRGLQCGHVATQERDGHKVCRSHAAALTNIYVTDRQADAYGTLRDILSRLVAADARLAEIVREVAA